ncbi:sulfopyruvate decarboxylase subunit alpha [Methanococcus vannielii SB]|jgi:sulfopyruvate decarboxylase subunit alpha|uniref:Sulfopyruvate decarboxylase subunit alpha n=1 Tax=Methanococcus vannielii (strain ATCC 35089 / DSM 1224 / JCM 13029 / OCM 148 / SB) TaxID=406327 RepID=A6US24_METVS|nr:sulfopyruvate decarboxylase subunit alpha [Methanococcus vannielii]ABR55296.1 sulfopyruvate decarboxylase subunit alpha [Methanococcus vannielii SB]
MGPSKAVFNGLVESKIDFVTSVPCANLKDVLNYLDEDKNIQHIPVTREEEGIGVCAGAYLAGKKTAILMQNSGLGNSINAIGSLLKVYKIPMVFIISHRGDLKEKISAQIPMGQWTKKLLETVEIPYYCPKTPEEAFETIKYASELSVNMEYPVAVLLDALYWEIR